MRLLVHPHRRTPRLSQRRGGLDSLWHRESHPFALHAQPPRTEHEANYYAEHQHVPTPVSTASHALYQTRDDSTAPEPASATKHSAKSSNAYSQTHPLLRCLSATPDPLPTTSSDAHHLPFTGKEPLALSPSRADRPDRPPKSSPHVEGAPDAEDLTLACEFSPE